jgi:protein-tyrosine phosphatase
MTDQPTPHRRVLVVCTHNRTRSVMAGGLLWSYLRNDPSFVVDTAGFDEPGLPAIPEALQYLSAHGIDAAAHRSSAITRELVQASTLVLTAERQHVTRIVTDFGGDFDHTFTIPEFAQQVSRGGDRPTGLAYLRADIPEVEDPTGRTHGVWESVWRDLDAWCRTIATALHGH